MLHEQANDLDIPSYHRPHQRPLNHSGGIGIGTALQQESNGVVLVQPHRFAQRGVFGGAREIPSIDRNAAIEKIAQLFDVAAASRNPKQAATRPAGTNRRKQDVIPPGRRQKDDAGRDNDCGSLLSKPSSANQTDQAPTKPDRC
jgi:hypothetical protein